MSVPRKLVSFVICLVFNAALKWNQVNRFLIDPYVIKLVRSNDTNDDASEAFTINYDLTLSVSRLKTKLREIIMAIQCSGDDNEWLSSNSELTTYSVIHSTENTNEGGSKTTN